MDKFMKDTRYYEAGPEPEFQYSCTCGFRVYTRFLGLTTCSVCKKDIKNEFAGAVAAFNDKLQDWNNKTNKLYKEFRADVCSKNGISLDTTVSLKASDLLNIMSELSEGNLHYEMEYFEMVLKDRIVGHD